MGLDRGKPPGTKERLTGEPSPPCASDDGTVAEGEDSALLPRSGRGRKERAKGSSSTRRCGVVVACLCC